MSIAPNLVLLMSSRVYVCVHILLIVINICTFSMFSSQLMTGSNMNNHDIAGRQSFLHPLGFMLLSHAFAIFRMHAFH